MTPEDILATYKQYGIDGTERAQASADSAAAAAPPQSGTHSGAQNQPRAPKTDTAVVWKLHADKTLEPVKVSLGITDHSYTQLNAVLKGELKEGDELVIRSVVPKNQTLGTIRR
jgi:hypothetical protein